MNPTEDTKKTEDTNKENFKYNLGVTSNLVWFSDDGFSAGFEVFKEDNDLVYVGTRCGYNDKHCDIDLPDGNYFWRVSGSLLPSSYRKGISWNFCGTSGAASSELAFTVSNGECNPMTIRNLSSICSTGDYMFDTTIVSSEVTLAGTVSLVGVSSDEVNDDHLLVVKNALLQELQDLSPHGKVSDDAVLVTVLRSPVSPVIPSNVIRTANISMERRLTLEKPILQIQFFATLQSKDFGVSGTDVDAVQILTEDLKKYLRRSMSSGMFLLRVRSQAKLSGVKNLQKVSQAELVTLAVHRISVENIAFEGTSNVVIMVAIMTGITLGFMFWAFRSRTKSISTVSLHSIDVSSRAKGVEIISYPFSEGMKQLKIHDFLTRSETHC